MPIRPENRARYPRDWKRIADAICERAGNRCEGSLTDPECRAQNGEPHPATDSRMVLTVAYRNHTPENCEAHNLKVMCQRCHLTYDTEHHKRTACNPQGCGADGGPVLTLPNGHGSAAAGWTRAVSLTANSA